MNASLARQVGQALISFGLVWLASCQRLDTSPVSTATAKDCAPLLFDRLGVGRNGSGRRDAASLGAHVTGFSDVLELDSVDVNCDGKNDMVVYGRALAPSRNMKLAVLLAPQWSTVLDVNSPVDGFERVAIAADLSGTGARDLVTVGQDEGGTTVRVFRWLRGTLSEVKVPSAYRIRNEEQWTPECVRQINPRLSADSQLILLRETIPRTSPQSHGHECGLPRDTLIISGDSLVKPGNQ